MAKLNIPLPDFLRPYHDEVRVVGHRIGFYDIVSRYEEGYSMEMLAAWFPTLPLAMIHKVLAFYLENKPAVDDYVREYGRAQQELEDQNPPRVTTRMLRERLERMRELAPR